MIVLVFVVFNLLLMTGLFLYGMYQFMQIEEKRKRRSLWAETALDEAELARLLHADGYDAARSRLMAEADVDRFTAERALDQIKRGSPAEERAGTQTR